MEDFVGKPWVTFFYDTNDAFDAIASPEKWRSLVVENAPSDTLAGDTNPAETVGARLMRLAHATSETHYCENGESLIRGDWYTPNFGSRIEHKRTNMSLAEWAKRNGMYELMNVNPSK